MQVFASNQLIRSGYVGGPIRAAGGAAGTQPLLRRLAPRLDLHNVRATKILARRTW